MLFVPGRGGGSVACACARARQRGVRPGLPLAEARALLDEHACFVPLDAAACRAALVKLAVWCQQFSPVVGLEEAELPECLLLDVTGCALLFKGEANLLRQVAAACHARGLQVRLALADTVGAAWAAAHFSRGDLTLIPPGLHEQAVRPLPVEALRLPVETVRRLRDLDLGRVEQVQALPRASLPARFGPELLSRLDQAVGTLPEPIRAVPATGPIEMQRHFDFPIRERSLLGVVVQELLAAAVAQVEARGLAVSRVVCRFDVATSAELPTRSVRLEARLLQASVSLPRLWELVHLQLERTRLPGEIWRVRLRVRPAPRPTEQETFFDTETQRGRRDRDALLERLTSRLGAVAVLQVGPNADPQPEFAVSYRKIMQKAEGRRQKERQKAEHVIVLRPAWLETRPTQVAALSVVPAGPPIRFHWQGHEHDILHAWGPERIETGWWRDRYVRRDYYRVETRTGQRFWLFRRLDDGQWFLHGSFE